MNEKATAFVIGSRDLEGRFDVNYYKPMYREIVGRLKSGPFDTRKLGDIVSFSKERWKRPKSGTFRYIEISDIDTFSAQITQAKELVVEDAPSRAQMLIKKDDIIISTTRPYRGAIALVTEDYDNCVCSTGFAIIRKLKMEVNRKYLLHILHSNLGLKQLEQRMTGGNYPAVTFKELRKIWMPIPPFEIQQKLVEIMDRALKEKESMEQKAENLWNSIDEYLLQKLEIYPPEFVERSPLAFRVGATSLRNNRWNVLYWKPEYREIVRAIEKGKYETKKLGEFIEKISYGASVKNIYSEDGIPFLRIMNLRPNEVDISDVVKLSYETKKEIGNCYVHQGEFLISRSGTIGIVAIVTEEADGFAFGSYMIKFKIKGNEMNRFYLSLILNSLIGRKQTERNKIGAIQTNITIPSIKNLVIPSPPEEIQDEIALEIKSRINRAKQLKKTAKKVLEDAKRNLETTVLVKLM